jgi:putative polymerase
LAFLALAWRYGGIRSAKTVFYTVSAIVVVFGLYEYFAAEDYTKHFNILRFYIDRGLVSEQQAQWVDGSYFVSATRGAERMLFPVLGQHRVSSIFLEPVSMGNFGAIAAAWALSLDVRQRRMAWVAAFVAVFALVAADARFGLFCVIAFLIARFAILRQWTNAAVIVLPIVTLVLLFIMGALNIGQGDDLPTRLAGSGRALAAMSPAELFGFQSDRLSTQDSGYYYIFKTFGLLFFVLTWLGFAATPSPGPQSQRFKLYLAIYMALLLCVSSTSLFALKTAALAFFLYGSLAVSEGLAQTARAHGAALRTALAP